MNHGYGGNKRAREEQRKHKRQDKELRRQERRERGPSAVPVVAGPASGLPAKSPSIDEIMRTLDGRTRESRSAAPIPARLFVGGLSREVNEDMLRTAFEAVGKVADAFVMRDRESGTPRGFGFVTMRDRKDAPKAISALDGSELHGQRIAVNLATERPR
jgi:hypothetical protein